MNAKELHDLYAPLHAAVPETRPTFRRDFRADAVFTRRLVWDDDRQGFAAELVGSTLPAGAQDSDGVFVDEAAALCRVAAEDFLHTGPDFWFIERNPDGWFCVVTFQLSYGNIERQWRPAGPTIHHALVAACLAVHGSSAPIPAPPSSPQPPHPPA